MLLFLILIFHFFFCVEWKYVKGSCGSEALPFYSGRENYDIFTPSNHPGSIGCISSFNSEEMGFFYGGTGFSNISNSIEMRVQSALWKFNFDNSNFAIGDGFLSDLEREPIYGETFLPSNLPGSRYGSVVISDPYEDSSIIYIFGGRYNHDGGTTNKTLFGDIWAFDISSQDWRIVTGSYSRETNFSSIFSGSDVHIGSRYLTMAWKTENMIYLFGGHGYVEYTSATDFVHGRLSDFFSYNLNTNEWRFINGNEGENVKTNITSSTVSSSGNTIQKGIPGGRSEGMTWRYCNVLYLWSGWGWGTESIAYTRLNDLWKWDIDQNEDVWTFVGGSLTGGYHSIEHRGTPGEFERDNVPGPRYGSVLFSEGNDLVILFGGKGQTPTISNYYYNDVWFFDNTLEMWTYESGGGNEMAGDFSSSFSSSNYPGGKYCMGHWEKDDVLYLVGGMGNGATKKNIFMNDVYGFKVTEQDIWAKYSSSSNRQCASSAAYFNVSFLASLLCVYVMSTFIFSSYY